MLDNLKKRFQEGFTLVEILIVVVIIGILAAIAIPTYFKYVERGYASDAKVQMKNILENSKLYYSENDEFPEDVKLMNEEGYANVPESTLRKWQFTIELTYESSQGITGNITAESLDEMKGGAGKILMYDVQQGKFLGYGTNEEIGG
jgi:prepilin-type N-terminal cleavage/methylation domain-containing protein|tara:strand:- start:1262 stop:1702 length:441 start_codon:yes stop_codon:yes gene_type:complete